jgi:hypothetical protein
MNNSFEIIPMLDHIIVDDDVISLEDSEKIKTLLFDSLPWYLGTGKESTVIGDDYNKFKNVQSIFEYGQLTHKFVDNGEIFSTNFEIPLLIVRAVIKKYNMSDRLLRAKANLMTRVHVDNSMLHNTPHVDDSVPHWVLIYYVNDSDGDTFIFNETGDQIDISSLTIQHRVTPKQGRIVIFDGKYLHAGMHPTLSDFRSVINFNISK